MNPYVMRYDGDDYFYHKNHLGNIMEITNIYQATVKTYDYDAFGTILDQSGSLGHNAFTYTGREYHAKSGLYYYRARFYDPAIGRFITPDPIGHLGGVNLYAYVGNDPVNLVDPLGLQEIFANLPPEIANDYAEAFEGTADYYNGMYDRAHELRSQAHQTFPGPENSFQRHYTVSYELAQECGVWPTRVMGLGNEVQGLILFDIPDLPGRLLGDRPWAFSGTDMFVNEMAFEDVKRQQCEQQR